MRITVVTVAAFAAIAFSGAAFAEEATPGSWTTTTGPAAMTDGQMDGVTAAGGPPTTPGFGQTTALEVRSLNAAELNSPPAGKGLGQSTLPGPAPHP
jgi:hypothetical protein